MAKRNNIKVILLNDNVSALLTKEIKLKRVHVMTFITESNNISPQTYEKIDQAASQTIIDMPYIIKGMIHKFYERIKILASCTVTICKKIMKKIIKKLCS